MEILEALMNQCFSRNPNWITGKDFGWMVHILGDNFDWT